MENSGSSRSERENPFAEITAEEPRSRKQKKAYHVFINHRGSDVKLTLASNIYHTLDLLGFRAFLDKEELELGDSIPQEIQEAMRTAELHIAIFSKNYAQSPWCLAELSFMVKSGTRILPVFYNVQPADLRWVGQGKGDYALAFSQHGEKGRYSSNKLDEWKGALQTVSNLNGFVLDANDKDEGKLVRKIVEDVKRILTKVVFGGTGGGAWDDGIYSGVRQIVVKFGTLIDSIQIEYDQNGQSVWSERHGGTGGAKTTGVGWPLGLETVNIRVEIMNAIRAMERTPFHLTTPSSSSLSSSNLDTESCTSFFTEKSTTLGNLIGITPAQHTSNNAHSEELRWISTNGRRAKNNGKMRSWRLLIGCTDMNIDEGAVSKTDNNNAPSLRDLLEAQRNARTVEENVYINVMYEASELEITPLLLGGQGIPESLNTRGSCASGMPSMEDISVSGSTLNILAEN